MLEKIPLLYSNYTVYQPIKSFPPFGRWQLDFGTECARYLESEGNTSPKMGRVLNGIGGVSSNVPNNRPYLASGESLLLAFVPHQSLRETLDKASVVGMLASIYEWVVIEPNVPLSLPMNPDSSVSQQMWPNGAKVNTRSWQSRDTEVGDCGRLRLTPNMPSVDATSSVVSSDAGMCVTPLNPQP